jgi:hypothetical protein
LPSLPDIFGPAVLRLAPTEIYRQKLPSPILFQSPKFFFFPFGGGFFLAAKYPNLRPDSPRADFKQSLMESQKYSTGFFIDRLVLI